jgi:hypothetical protein
MSERAICFAPNVPDKTAKNLKTVVAQVLPRQESLIRVALYVTAQAKRLVMAVAGQGKC